MIYILRRTSTYDENPLPEDKRVFQKNITFIEIRTLPTPQAFDAKFSFSEGKWLEVGTNHRLINGHIARDLEEVSQWVIDLDDHELIEFAKTHGNIILQFSVKSYFPILEIYDSYRE